VLPIEDGRRPSRGRGAHLASSSCCRSCAASCEPEGPSCPPSPGCAAVNLALASSACRLASSLRSLHACRHQLAPGRLPMPLLQQHHTARDQLIHQHNSTTSLHDAQGEPAKNPARTQLSPLGFGCCVVSVATGCCAGCRVRFLHGRTAPPQLRIVGHERGIQRLRRPHRRLIHRPRRVGGLHQAACSVCSDLKHHMAQHSGVLKVWEEDLGNASAHVAGVTLLILLW
jgi:hypothetical protein